MLSNVKRGDKVVMVGFSGFKLGEFTVTYAGDTYLQVQTRTAMLTFNRATGKQMHIEDAKKAKFPNKVITLEAAKGLLSQEEARAKKKAPVAEKIDRAIEIDFSKTTEVKETPPKAQSYNKKPKHPQYDSIKTCIDLDIPVYLVGEAGTGKNHTLLEIAGDLGLEFYFTNSVQQEYKITGFIDAGGNYHETEFYKAFTKGGLFFLDEIDASIPEVLVLLNAGIANRYFEFPNGRVTAHPSFRVVAAGNTVGSGANDLYTGRLVLDSATLDRFAVIEFDYDREIELSLAKGNVDLVNFVRSMREHCRRNGVRGTFSYRMIMAVQKLETAKMPLNQIIKIAVVKGLDKDTIRTLKVENCGKYAHGLKEVQGV